MAGKTLYQNVEDLTIGGFQLFQSFANQAVDAAYAATSALQAFNPQPVSLNVPFDVTGSPSNYVPPPRPQLSLPEFSIPDDAYPSDLDVESVSLDSSLLNEQFPSAPPGVSATYSPPSRPDALQATPPGDPPALSEYQFPADISVSIPEEPLLYTLSFPQPPDIELPPFEGVRPTVTFAVPEQTFAFTETEYASTLLTAVKARVALMLEGGTGLPAAIEQALYDRARSTEEVNAQRAMQEVSEEFASRGWTEPDGALAARKLEVTQNSQNQRNSLRRQIEIENKQIEIENLRFAVAQGIVLEQTLINAHMAVQERRLQAARFAFEVVLQIFNAQVALFNAQVQAYQADAQVFRDRVQAVIAEVELYRQQIEAQKAIGEINKTLVEAYETRVRALLTTVELYRTQVQAVTARIDADRLKLEAHRTKVATYAEIVRAWEIEWNGYAAAVRAELGRVEAADIAARTYATRVSAVQTKYQTAFEKLRADVSVQQLNVTKFEAELRRLLAFVELARSEVASGAQLADAEARLYVADGQIAAADAAAQDRAFELRAGANRNAADIALRNGEINLNGFLQASAQELEAMRTVAQTTQQLAGSAMSAINISGSLQGQVSASNNTNNTRSKTASFEGNGTVAW